MLWVLLFCMISFFHSYAYHFFRSQLPGFSSNISDVIAIGSILTFGSISASFLIFIWMIFLIRKSQDSSSNWMKINAIPLIFGIVITIFIQEATASWGEAIIYSGSYLMAFLLAINFFNLKAQRKERYDPDLLDQVNK